MQEENLLARDAAIGTRIRQRLEAMARRGGVVLANVRGLGAVISFDVLKGLGGEPDGPAAKLITRRALERGLILRSCGSSGETIRILVPLTISDQGLVEGLDTLEQALAS